MNAPYGLLVGTLVMDIIPAQLPDKKFPRAKLVMLLDTCVSVQDAELRLA
jgi:hypothetical protein